MAKHDPKDPSNTRAVITGTYLAYDANGKEIWRKEGWVVGHDTIPSGLSIGMRAMAIIDPASGERLAKWDPWGLLR